MTIIFGKNTLEALENLPLTELHVLYQSSANRSYIFNIDEHLLKNRPDWTVYRLLRKRTPGLEFKLPKGYEGGKKLLLDQLKEAADSHNFLIKWSVYGLLAFVMLRFAEVEKEFWYVRRPQKLSLSSEEISDHDRINEEDLGKILMWMKSRQKKFEKEIRDSKIIINAKVSFKTRHERQLSLDELISIEKLLLLALGKIAIFLVSRKLKENQPDDEGYKDAQETFDIISEYLSVVNGGWRPGEVIFLTGLKHFRDGFRRDDTFYSCFLPFTAANYYDWLAAAMGRFAKETSNLLDDSTRIFIGLTSIQHREWQFLKIHGDDKKTAAESLIISIDRISSIALNSGHLVLAGSLAARYLAVGNFIGWKKVKEVRLKQARYMKSVAKMSGCLVQGEAANLDFSDEHINYDEQNKLLPENPHEYREMRRILSRQKNDTNPSLTPEAHKLCKEEESLIKVADSLGIESPKTERDRFKILRIAAICLTPGKGKFDDDLNNLIDNNHSTFNLFLDTSCVSGIVSLSKQLFDRNKFADSVLNKAENVVKFSELLLYWLERPYMADIGARSEWQRQLWQVYSSLSNQERDRLSLDDKLLIYAAIANVTAASMKDLRNELHADQLEKTIYEERGRDSHNLSTRNANARTSLQVNSNDMSMILNSYQERGLVETAFIQMMLAPGGKDLRLLITRKCGDTVEHREGIVSFTKCTSQEDECNTWNDFLDNVGQHPYFNNKTGNLSELDTTPLGHPSVSALWQRIKELILDVGFEKIPGHLCISPDPELARIPWQFIALKEADQPDDYPLISLVHGLRWLYISIHELMASTTQRGFNNGIHAWISPNPTPNEKCDIRKGVKENFFGVENNYPALIDKNSISLSVVFGHGSIIANEPLANVEAIENLEEWNYVRDSRICVILSCETGDGTSGALGDFLSISHKLCRKSRAVLLPPVKVSHTATEALSAVFHQAIEESLTKDTWKIQDVYKEAIRRHPGVALFSLWGLSYEPLVMRS